MYNCNDCINLKVVVETEDGLKYSNHICKKHDISLRYTPKRFTGYIWPCKECNSEDFEKK